MNGFCLGGGGRLALPALGAPEREPSAYFPEASGKTVARSDGRGRECGEILGREKGSAGQRTMDGEANTRRRIFRQRQARPSLASRWLALRRIWCDVSFFVLRVPD